MPKFSPKKPFTLFGKSTDGASHFGNKTKNSVFISRLIKRHIDMGGIDVFVYRLKGTFAQDEDEFGTKNDPHGPDTADDENLFDVDDQRENPFGPRHEGPTDVGSYLGIQDTVLMENRDREYDFNEIPIIRCVYTVSQNEIEYARFGIGLANDVITIEVHTDSMEKQLERRLVPGDVIQLKHLREVGVDGRIADKWMEVSSIVWSPTSYDPMYARHVSAVTLRPIRHQQEFLDIMKRQDEYGRSLEQQVSERDAVMAVTEANQEKARRHANNLWYDTTTLYWCPDHPDRHPSHFMDDAVPDNGEPVQQGTSFPDNPEPGLWFLRTDFNPSRLFRFLSDTRRWKHMETRKKREWQPFNWVPELREFMSDRSDGDKERPWELRSIHDVLTDREDRSNPSPDEPEVNREPFEFDTNSDNDGELK